MRFTPFLLVAMLAGVSVAQQPQVIPQVENQLENQVDQLARAEVDAIRPPVIMVRPNPEKPSKQLAISRVSADVVIVGSKAETSMTLSFSNELDRELEGTLFFPLPEGSTVSGYALDIDGAMVDAVIVEKQQARIIFESEQRKGIDPGLVEWLQGNNFQTRVWPIPAKGMRTVRVEYVSELVVSEDGTASYHLPLKFPVELEKLAVKVRSVGDRRLTIQGGDWLKLEEQPEATVLQGELKGVKPEVDLVVSLPVVDQQVNVGRRPQDRKYYFEILERPALPDVKKIGDTRKAPSRIGLFWDVSLSRANADMSAELKLLQSVLKSADDVTVDLVLFSNEMQPAKAYEIKDGDASDLIAALKSAVYDGGTSLENLILPADTHGFLSKQELDAAKKQAASKYDYHLLFTDGLDNLGSDLPRQIHQSRDSELGKTVPVFAIANSPRANHPILRHLSQVQGGAYFNISQQPESELNSIANSIARVPARLLMLTKVEFDPKQISEVYPSTPARVAGQVSIAGQLLVPEAKIQLHFSYGTEKFTTEYTLKQDEHEFNRLIPRIWAQKKVDSMLAFPAKHKEALLEVGREFSIVTPSTSLLVLETLDQYVEHGVEPPASREKMRIEWKKQMEEKEVAQKVAQEHSRKEKLKEVLAMWQERLQWWEKEYKYPKDFRYKEPQSEKDAESPAPGDAAPNSDAAPDVREPEPAASQPSAGFGGGALGERADLESGVEGKEEGEEESSKSSIELAPWNPKTPYLVAMKKAGPAKAYAVYLAQRKKFAGSPAFYLDCASYFFREGSSEDGCRVLTNVLELELKDPRLLRIVAHKLQQEGYLNISIDLFEQVLEMRPEEPQSYRDLALALAVRGQVNQANESTDMAKATVADYRRATELLHQVIVGDWDDRFPGIEAIALNELNSITARASRLATWSEQDFEVKLDKRLTKQLDGDIRILISWDTDLTDIDAWIVEPSGEKCFYSHNRTTIGGMMTHDFTQGYGPEVYNLRKAMPGKYEIKAHFYGSSEQSLTGGTTITATVITNFGRPNEQRKSITVRLNEPDEEVEIGSIVFEGNGLK